MCMSVTFLQHPCTRDTMNMYLKDEIVRVGLLKEVDKEQSQVCVDIHLDMAKKKERKKKG